MTRERLLILPLELTITAESNFIVFGLSAGSISMSCLIGNFPTNSGLSVNATYLFGIAVEINSQRSSTSSYTRSFSFEQKSVKGLIGFTPIRHPYHSMVVHQISPENPLLLM